MVVVLCDNNLPDSGLSQSQERGGEIVGQGGVKDDGQRWKQNPYPLDFLSPNFPRKSRVCHGHLQWLA
jgi:hypothetical protein